MDTNNKNNNGILDYNDYLFGEGKSDYKPVTPTPVVQELKPKIQVPEGLDISYSNSISQGFSLNITKRDITQPVSDFDPKPVFPKIEEEVFPEEPIIKANEMSTIIPVAVDSLSHDMPNDLGSLPDEITAVLQEPEIENTHIEPIQPPEIIEEVKPVVLPEKAEPQAYDSVKPVFPPIVEEPVEEIKPPVLPQVEPIKEIVPEKQEEVVNIVKPIDEKPKKGILKIVLILFIVILLGIAGFFIYSNWEKVSTFVKDAIDFSKNQEVVVTENNNVEQDDINTAITSFMTGKFQVNDSGGFGYIYTKTVNGKAEEKTGEISLGNGVSATEDYSYFENGALRLYDLGTNKRVVWDMNRNKYILFVNEKKYFAVSAVSDPYYKNYAGQHILQDIVKSYRLNKNLFKKLDGNVWSWKWSLFSPIDYVSKMEFDTKIYITNGKINKIEVYSPTGESLLGTFSFTYEQSNITEDMILPKDYTRVLESELTGK